VFDRTPVGKQSSWLLLADQLALLALGLTLVMWPVSAIVRARYGARFPLEGARAQAHRYMRFATLAAFAAAVGWCWVIMWLIGGGELQAAKADPWVHVVQALTLLGWVGGLLVALYSLSVVWRGPSSWFGKLWSAVLVLSILPLLWTAWVFHLLGFGVQY
jgi:hypothetical protein